MFVRSLIFLIAASAMMQAVVIDRIAVVIGKSIVKQSDIDRDMRVTEFLNGEPLKLDAAARKAAANRLIDQVFIRREIMLRDYPQATVKDAERQLANLRKEKYRSDEAFSQALRRYGLDPLELRTQFQWQLTVLQFIDARFRPAAYVSDSEIETYYREHGAALRRQTGKTSLADLRQDITNLITGEKVNKLFFTWLDEQRKDAKINYLEQGLQ
jgi:parvulin-like peptidyl-prolyl isomerase